MIHYQRYQNVHGSFAKAFICRKRQCCFSPNIALYVLPSEHLPSWGALPNYGAIGLRATNAKGFIVYVLNV